LYCFMFDSFIYLSSVQIDFSWWPAIVWNRWGYLFWTYKAVVLFFIVIFTFYGCIFKFQLVTFGVDEFIFWNPESIFRNIPFTITKWVCLFRVAINWTKVTLRFVIWCTDFRLFVVFLRINFRLRVVFWRINFKLRVVFWYVYSFGDTIITIYYKVILQWRCCYKVVL